MYISVIPFSHTFSIEPFTYFVSPDWQEQVQIGCLVEIPLGKSIGQGIVASILDDPSNSHLPDEELRPILSVIAHIPLLHPYQIAMIFAICQRYFIPLHKVLRMFLPAPLLSRLDKKNYILEENTNTFPHLPAPQYRILSYKERAFSASDFEKYREPGSAFIFPDDFFLTYIAGATSEGARIPSDSTPVYKAKQWMNIYSGKEEIIVGTRRLLYYNLARYRHIYYIEDAFSDEDYQYPHNLRNLDILRILADRKQFSITIITSSPTLELLAKFRDFQIVSDSTQSSKTE